MSSKPEVTILYCHECGYLPDTVNMVEKLLQQFNHKLDGIKLIAGSRGAFEVTIGGQLVFSKLKTGYFPETKEIAEKIRESLTPK